MDLEPVFVPCSTQESSKGFYFYFPEDNPQEKKKIHNTETEKKSEHLMSNNLKATYPQIKKSNKWPFFNEGELLRCGLTRPPIFLFR